MAAPLRRRKLIGHRRRVEDEGEDEGGPEQFDVDDDSLSDGSLASDDIDAGDSDTSNVEDTPLTPSAKKRINARKSYSEPQGSSAVPKYPKSTDNVVSDPEFMMNGLSMTTETSVPVQAAQAQVEDSPKSSVNVSAPIVVSSNSVSAPGRDSSQGPIGGRRRNEHEEYRRKRDEDPSFVPNRGAFFMHDHRHAGPSANGFRPFGRPSRGRGRGMAGSFAPAK